MNALFENKVEFVIFTFSLLLVNKFWIYFFDFLLFSPFSLSEKRNLRLDLIKMQDLLYYFELFLMWVDLNPVPVGLFRCRWSIDRRLLCVKSETVWFDSFLFWDGWVFKFSAFPRKGSLPYSRASSSSLSLSFSSTLRSLKIYHGPSVFYQILKFLLRV